MLSFSDGKSKMRPETPLLPELFCCFWPILSDGHFKNGFSSGRGLKRGKSHIKSAIAPIHSCIRSVSFSIFRDPFLDVLRLDSTFQVA
jgi:hypothetical protein